MSRSVVILRGHQVNPWELGAWERLRPDYRVAVLVTAGNRYELPPAIERVPVRALGDWMPGRMGALAVRVPGDRYLGLRRRLEGADIVHAAELGYWFSWQAARLRAQLGFKLALTVWETLPFRTTYRNLRTRRYRELVLRETDLFLAATERARDALLLEGAPAERIVVAPPGINADRFAVARTPVPPADGTHVVLSVGRLVWEKGHQDLLRALALLRERGAPPVRATIVGVGPEEGRLRRYARDLGVDDAVQFMGAAAYDELPALYARASCLVLASIPSIYWDEQFGMVLAEAMAAHLPIVTASSGAIPEVVGASGELFGAGDWEGLATALARGPLSRAPAARRAPEPARLERYSAAAAAERLTQAYDRLTAS